MSHYGKENKDRIRQKELEGLGLSFLRFDDLNIKFKMEKVLNEIKKWIEENHDNNPPAPF